MYHLKRHNKESFVSNLCGPYINLDSIKQDMPYVNTVKYVNELDNKTIEYQLNSRTVPFSYNTYFFIIDLSQKQKKHIYNKLIQYKLTDWFSQFPELKGFSCKRLILRLVKVDRRTSNLNKLHNINMNITADAIIHRESKNHGKHIKFDAELLNSKLNVNKVEVKGIVPHDKIIFQSSSGFSPAYGMYSTGSLLLSSYL